MKKIIIIFLLLLCIGGGVFFYQYKFNNKKPEEPKTEEPNEEPNIYASYNEEEMNYLNNLMGLKYYDETKIDRYLNYMNSDKCSYEEVIRVVNTNNDLEYFTDAVSANLEDDLLILVNKYNVLDEDYKPDDLKKVNSNYSYCGELREEAADAFLTMAKAASKEGLKLINTSPFRSYELQTKLYEGYSKRDGKAAADRYSARPGFSEHQTGLATDIVTPTSNFDTFENTKEFTWLKSNSYKYGFILRYKKGMEYITGYMYEPWHYRYVGLDAAKTIYENDLTFEEYYYYYVKKQTNESV